jgi:ssDNA-binding Zn-finger/Zn-ribbon topoisomerase 1
MGDVVKVDGWQCRMPKCRHIWPVQSRAVKGVVKAIKPRRCPKCMSTLWERGPRTRKQITEAARHASQVLWAKRRANSVDPAQGRMFA